ncbi:LETM1-like protein-domain-containing protein [Dichotomocladium elegans]|nr:LETM1-like protein-domain-containing protein [Dichotomocladium elegans]
MIKLIPFGIIFLVLPESASDLFPGFQIPLWVIFAPGIIPSTCVQESQIVGVYAQRKKLDDARQVMTKNVLAAATVIPGISAEDFLTLRGFEKIAKNYNYDFELKQIRKGNLSAYCRFMGLPSWGTKSMLERRLNSHMDYLLKDDQLLSKEGIDTLTRPQLQQAVEERGMRSLDVDDEQLRRRLDYWIKIHLNEQPIARGLLVFSRMFLLNANYK